MLRGRFLWRNHPNVKLFQLLGVDRARRAEHEVLMGLRLRKRNHVADVFGVLDRHHQAIDAGRDPAMRGYAVFERVEQVAELRLDALAVHAQDLEDPFLQLAVMYADASTRDLD